MSGRKHQGWIHVAHFPMERDNFSVVWDDENGRNIASIGSGGDGMANAMKWFEHRAGRCVQLGEKDKFGYQVFTEEAA